MEAEARRQNDLAYQGTAQVNKLIALSNVPDYDKLLSQTPATLEFLAQNQLWRNYYYIRTVIAESYRRKKEYPKAMEEAEVTRENLNLAHTMASRVKSELIVRTNLLYDAFLLPTLGVEWRVNRYVGIKVDGSLNYRGGSTK